MNAPSVLPMGLIPPEFFAFIAGGYAACPQRANDIDVWVIDKQHNLHVARRRVLAYVQNNRYALNLDGSTFEMDATDYYVPGVNILKVCRVPYPHPITQQPTTIHIMVADGGVQEVLKGFDVSTHQIAILWNDREERGPQWSPLDVPPVAIPGHENAHTAGRMAKIQARYADLVTAKEMHAER